MRASFYLSLSLAPSLPLSLLSPPTARTSRFLCASRIISHIDHQAHPRASVEFESGENRPSIKCCAADTDGWRYVTYVAYIAPDFLVASTGVNWSICGFCPRCAPDSGMATTDCGGQINSSPTSKTVKQWDATLCGRYVVSSYKEGRFGDVENTRFMEGVRLT
ncbi:uncharacterized protein EV422DRAFT_279421 [Fimicolochytrium jonesii]|uniref:uncharacterized protein n=1 Tax=Fimicolochytrium jonesii TaxID=1396493 RepID=UPI0022FEC584|nr:uncharacterized protein EV422DRAFT_279421 [Fimicolochytrium jonesii]KAI8816579.1 hypothetical protein EV422DRAFT_279421 [Fimicolochytrium jonesii]